MGGDRVFPVVCEGDGEVWMDELGSSDGDGEEVHWGRADEGGVNGVFEDEIFIDGNGSVRRDEEFGVHPFCQ